MNRLILIVFIFFIVTGISAQPNFTESYPDTIHKRRLYTAIGVESAFYVAGFSFLNYVWYKDHEAVPFHFYDDSEGYLQMDKAGHAYGAYRYSFSAYYALRWAGVGKKKALIYGGPIGLLFQTPIEIFDGLYEGYGFSWFDMAANTFGSLIFTAQEALFNDQIILMKFSYKPSKYPEYHSILGESHAERFFLDYNAHTYWWSGGLKNLTSLAFFPSWLNLAVGYSANGMIYEFNNPQYYRGEPFPHFDRHRQLLFSLDVSFSKIPTKKKWLRSVFRTVNLIKIPFPALEINPLNGVKFRGFYF